MRYLCVNGSRGFRGILNLKMALDSHIPLGEEKSFTILSGGCRGPDLMAESYAEMRGIPVKRFDADWDKHGKAAGPIRNREMINEADELISFWDGESRGTKGTIDMANEKGIQVTIIMTTDPR